MSSQDHSTSSTLPTFRRTRPPALRVDLGILPSPDSPLEYQRSSSWYTGATRQIKRPRTAPQSGTRSPSPSFRYSINDIHDQLPSIAQDLEEHEDPSDRITCISDCPVVPPLKTPLSLPPLPIKQIGFLNRSPKTMQTGNDTSPDSPLISFPLRRPNAPPLHSYKRPSTAPSREPSAGSVTYPYPHTPQSAKAGSEAKSMPRPASHRRQDTPPLLFGKRPPTSPSQESSVISPSTTQPAKVPIGTETDGTVILLPLRKSSGPPPRSYKRPSTAPPEEPRGSSSQSLPHAPPPRSPTVLRKKSLSPVEPKRGRRTDSFLDLDREERKAMIPPFFKTGSASQVSLVSPMTTSMLPNDSMSSLPIHDYSLDDNSEKGSLAPSKRKSLRKGKSPLKTNSASASASEDPIITEDVFAAPKPRHLPAMASSPHLAASASPLKVELRATDGMGGRDGERKGNHDGGTHRKDSTVKRVWKSLVHRGHW